MTHEQWEAKCKCCARCCYEKIDFEGEVYFTDTPCEKLDLETLRCTVYADRDIRRPGCVRLTPELVTKGFLPGDCPYVENISDYVAPVPFDETNR